MSELPKWPSKADYTFGIVWKDITGTQVQEPEYLDTGLYEHSRADAAIARLRLAVEALEFTRAHIAKPDWHGSIHGRAFNALHEIGPIPE
jgi:hypothetical protein